MASAQGTADRTVQAGRVVEQDLGRRAAQHSQNTAARGLGPGRDDGQLLAKQRVEQRRLAGIRAGPRMAPATPVRWAMRRVRSPVARSWANAASRPPASSATRFERPTPSPQRLPSTSTSTVKRLASFSPPVSSHRAIARVRAVKRVRAHSLSSVFAIAIGGRRGRARARAHRPDSPARAPARGPRRDRSRPRPPRSSSRGSSPCPRRPPWRSVRPSRRNGPKPRERAHARRGPPRFTRARARVRVSCPSSQSSWAS